MTEKNSMWLFDFDTIFIPDMISKSQVKHIRSLDDKKYRYECKQFIVEGEKMLDELLQSGFDIAAIYAIREWTDRQSETVLEKYKPSVISTNDLGRISSLKTPNEVLAVVRMPQRQHLSHISKVIAVDNIQDPGNLGSIIRIADWYGISHVICNTQTADVYNSKVLQSSMGSIFRVQCVYTDLKKFLTENKELSSYACVLEGKDVNRLGKITEGILVIGNESRGISEEITALCDHKISIPRQGYAESLNAAVATGIICNALLG